MHSRSEGLGEAAATCEISLPWLPPIACHCLLRKPTPSGQKGKLIMSAVILNFGVEKGLKRVGSLYISALMFFAQKLEKCLR